MEDKNKTKSKLIEELATARGQIAELTMLNNQLYQEVSQHKNELRFARNSAEEYPPTSGNIPMISKPTERKRRLVDEVLNEITLAIISQTDFETILTQILHQLYRIVPYTGANIALVTEDTLQVVCWQGYYGSENFISTFRQQLRDFPLDFEAVQLNHPLIIPDTYRDPRWIILANTTWIRACVAVPISSPNRVLGLLRLDSDTPAKFSTEDFSFLLPLAEAMAMVLEDRE